MTNSVWHTLEKVDVSTFIEKKNGFNYLSWSDAWAALKRIYPDAQYIKHTFNALPFMSDANGNAYVQVTVRIPSANEECTEIMPVLNHANRAIQNPDSFQVNVSLQRCLAKAIAGLGLGSYIFRGEDFPSEVPASAPAPQNFKKPQAMSIAEEVRLAPDLESLKALFNRVSLRVTPEEKQLFSNRKMELTNNG